MLQLFSLLATIALFLWSAAVRPSSFKCPGSGVLSRGIGLDGDVECFYYAPSPELRTGAPDPPVGYLSAKVYCTGGAVPIVVGRRTVGCQRVSVDARARTVD